VILVFITIAIVSIYWHSSRGRLLLENWAQDNNYELVSAEYRTFFKGPFFWTALTNSQAVYSITVQTDDGQIRSGWTRCGGWWVGLLSDKVEVYWDL
jgi:hypothetical protein